MKSTASSGDQVDNDSPAEYDLLSLSPDPPRRSHSDTMLALEVERPGGRSELRAAIELGTAVETPMGVVLRQAACNLMSSGPVQ